MHIMLTFLLIYDTGQKSDRKKNTPLDSPSNFLSKWNNHYGCNCVPVPLPIGPDIATGYMQKFVGVVGLYFGAYFSAKVGSN